VAIRNQCGDASFAVRPTHHRLGSAVDVDAIAEAIHKVLANIEEVRGLEHKAIRNQNLSRADRES
jgi:hypothetical protein